LALTKAPEYAVWKGYENGFAEVNKALQAKDTPF